jgi:hypothetical protein
MHKVIKKSVIIKNTSSGASRDIIKNTSGTSRDAAETTGIRELEVLNATKAHTGRYSCTVRDHNGVQNSASFDIVVFGKYFIF